jgi:hypothetical protein
MATQYEMDMIAELAAINTALISAVKAIALISARESGQPPEEYLRRLLEGGSEALATTNYWSIPAEQRDAVVENARARLADLITSIRF